MFTSFEAATEPPTGARRNAGGPHMVAVVSDSPLARTGLAQFLALEPTLTVQSTVESLAALQQSGEHPDIVIIDLHVRNAHGIGAMPWAVLTPGNAVIMLCPVAAGGV